MFRASKENLYNYLDTKKEVSIDDVKTGLDNYIGANGSVKRSQYINGGSVVEKKELEK